IILAGDFAQLPPVIQGSALYQQGTVSKLQNFNMSLRDQENTIGLLTWHQITTVVILKQNMRQQSQTDEDSALRTALENMRYAACTTEDLNFLNSRTVGPGPLKPKLNEFPFRDVSIITAWNAQKDLINDLGS
ncbi:hypothetical protein HYPSUDRAFT_110311, partial [Hypholoma sublateritium FD-334 SS-4]